MSEFKPLDVQRAIRDDTELLRADKALLWTAVLRTDNSTRKVRASLAMLAKDAGYKPNVATRVFAETNLPVMRYFEKIERRARVVNLWFHPTTRLSMRVSHSEGESLSEGSRLSIGVTSTVDEGDPSALSASTAIYTLARPSSFQGDEQAQDIESPSDSLSEKPLSKPDVTAAGQLPCGCFLGASCPACRDDQPRASKHSPEKQREFYEDHIERNEGLGLDGTPLDRDRSLTGYRSRQG